MQVYIAYNSIIMTAKSLDLPAAQATAYLWNLYGVIKNI